jgi:RNA polymerase sigma factor (sigma-70 family)
MSASDESCVSPAPVNEVAGAVDHLFRRESGRMIAALTRYFGPGQLHLVEDVVQDALIKAMQTWPYTGIPNNPSAWILHAARNRALDQKRRSRVWLGKEILVGPQIEECLQQALKTPAPQFEEEIRDSQLRMMFVCCHPDLPEEAQLALTLKTLCGFGEREIASAFLASPAAVAKRLVRARQWLRDAEVSMDLPSSEELNDRSDVVLQVLYLLFNEGYKSSHGDVLLKEDLCAEALRLTELLFAHVVGNQPKIRALLALMNFAGARLPARMDAHGNMLLLEEQDRSLWDRRKIGLGLRWLEASGEGNELSRFHVEAGIAACHCLAPSYASTDWARILDLYDLLVKLDPSPVVALNRAVAVAKVQGARAGIAALKTVANERALLSSYHLYHAVMGQLWMEANEITAAGTSFRRALELAEVEAERIFLQKRIQRCLAQLN